jgi:hypothetical protein
MNRSLLLASLPTVISAPHVLWLSLRLLCLFAIVLLGAIEWIRNSRSYKHTLNSRTNTSPGTTGSSKLSETSMGWIQRSPINRRRFVRTSDEERRGRELIAKFKEVIPYSEKGHVFWWPLLFAALCVAVLYAVVIMMQPAINNIVTYTAPEYIGIVAVHGPHRYKIINIENSQTLEIDTCRNSNEQWYAGYVLSWLSFLNTGKCQLMGPKGLGYTFVRSGDALWAHLHGELTREAGPHQPVIALNCNGTPDDSDTVCEGGEAKFTKETANGQGYATESSR